MTLHPQARALLDRVEESGMPRLDELTPAQARTQARLLIDVIGPGPELPLVEDFVIPTAAGQIAARRYVPDDPPATVLWLHGGGWVICDLDTHDAMCRALALSSGCRVIAVDYRLAPEHPFPAPLEDCWDALCWMAEQYSEAPLILGGDSAGGNLTAVCTLRARDRGGPELALQVLVYPATDRDPTRPSVIKYGSLPDTFMTAEEMAWFWRHHMADPDASDSPEVVPLHAADHSGLPPAVVITAEYDPLRDEGLAYVERLRSAQVPVAHHHYDDMIHAFFEFVNIFQRADEAVAQVGSEIQAAVARQPYATIRRTSGGGDELTGKSVR
jgi:acetyl esterase/lipase